MWSIIKWLAMRFAPVRWLFKVFGMALFVPLALLLKTIGLPVLIVLGVLALPILFLLFVFGLPIMFVLLAGGALMGLLFAVLSVGLVVVKLAIVIGLPIYLMWKLFSWLFGRRRRNGDTPNEPVDPN